MADWVFYWRRVEKERKRERKEEEEERMTGDKRGRIVEEKEKNQIKSKSKKQPVLFWSICFVTYSLSPW